MYSVQDSTLLSTGLKTLRDTLGSVRTEMFIALIKQIGFDYTEWRKDNLWVGLTSEEISNRAVDVIYAHIDELPENIRTTVQTKDIHALNNVI